MLEPENTSGKENSSLALSGMILGLIGLVCSMFANWRVIGMVIGAVGLGVSIYSMIRLNKRSQNKMRAIFGILFSVAAIVVALCFVFILKPAAPETTTAEPVPAELQHSDAHDTDHSNALQKLQGLTDTSAAPAQ